MTDPIPDPARFEAARHAMVVSQLRPNAVNDPRVVEAMAQTPREAFVPVAMREGAYRDRLVPLPNDRWMNTPLATARLIVAAEVRPDDRVLVIGSGTGYAAAVLSTLAAQVVALEEDADLTGAAPALPPMVEQVQGPLNAGWSDGAPYDVIIIDGAVEAVPEAIVAQLAIDGRLATGVADRGLTRLAVGRRTAGGFGLSDFADLDCAPLPGFAAPKTFRFA